MYSRLRVIGQLFAGYIALEGDDGLILVDQHAAHERVTFEKLRAELRAGGVRVQAMLTPVPIELNPARAAQVHQALSEFRAMGFELEPFGPATLLLKGAPAVFGADGGARLLAEMIDAMGEDGFRLAAPRRSRTCSNSSPATARCGWAGCSRAGNRGAARRTRPHRVQDQLPAWPPGAYPMGPRTYRADVPPIALAGILFWKLEPLRYFPRLCPRRDRVAGEVFACDAKLSD